MGIFSSYLFTPTRPLFPGREETELCECFQIGELPVELRLFHYEQIVVNIGEHRVCALSDFSSFVNTHSLSGLKENAEKMAKIVCFLYRGVTVNLIANGDDCKNALQSIGDLQKQCGLSSCSHMECAAPPSFQEGKLRFCFQEGYRIKELIFNVESGDIESVS